jgi:hypothetical protein
MTLTSGTASTIRGNSSEKTASAVTREQTSRGPARLLADALRR